MTEFGIAPESETNLDTRLEITRSSAEFLERLETYFPDEETRNQKIKQILLSFIDNGKLEGTSVSLTPTAPEITDADIYEGLGLDETEGDK